MRARTGWRRSSSDTRPGPQTTGRSSAENDVDSRQDQIELPLGYLPGPLGQRLLVESHDLGDVRYRLFRQTRGPGGKREVSSGRRPT